MEREPDIMQLCATAYRWADLLWVNVVGVAVIGHWVYMQLTFVCLFVLNGFCGYCGRVKGPDLHEQNVHHVLFNREKPASETFEMPTKGLVMMPWVKGKLLIGFHVLKVARLRQWSLNVQVAHRQVGLMKMRKSASDFPWRLLLMMCVTF